MAIDKGDILIEAKINSVRIARNPVPNPIAVNIYYKLFPYNNDTWTTLTPANLDGNGVTITLTSIQSNTFPIMLITSQGFAQNIPQNLLLALYYTPASGEGIAYNFGADNQIWGTGLNAGGSFPSRFFTLYEPSGTPQPTPITLNFSNTQNMKSVNVNGIERTTFPYTTTVSSTTNIAMSGIDSPVLTFNNGQNMKSVIDGSTAYSEFPVSLTTATDKTFILNGKDDPEITVNYTNTTPPIITNT